jgi:hypothetical protein
MSYQAREIYVKGALIVFKNPYFGGIEPNYFLNQTGNKHEIFT